MCLASDIRHICTQMCTLNRYMGISGFSCELIGRKNQIHTEYEHRRNMTLKHTHTTPCMYILFSHTGRLGVPSTLFLSVIRDKFIQSVQFSFLVFDIFVIERLSELYNCGNIETPKTGYQKNVFRMFCSIKHRNQVLF